MSGLAFINYRRDETSPIAQALYLQLKQTFGSGQLFMDVNSIRAGDEWPARIHRKLDAATVVLALIGPDWLSVLDEVGKRRIDDRSDWVRKELVHALQRGTPIIPLIINDTKNLPDPRGLPSKLRGLNFSQAKVLRLEPSAWHADLQTLSYDLLDHGLQREERRSHTPSVRKKETPALSELELAAALKTLPEWEEWVDAIALEYPRERHELRRTFLFTTFLEAVDFMKFVAPRFEDREHHPLWENDLNEVKIRMTTWDKGSKITEHDVAAARMVDEAYRQFKSGRT
jgi:pterin-4a-carbinolamine dehydratase